MKNKYVMPGLSIFLIAGMAVSYKFLFYYAISGNGWITGDWLVNFDAGFVRRGLSGYLIIGLSDFISIKPNFTAAIVQAIVYTAFMLILFFLICKKQINIWFLILLLSPVTLLFPMYSMGAIGRKEIILFFIFGLYILCLDRNLQRSFFVVFLFSITLLFATLFHELVFFYAPYFLFAAYLKSKINHEPFHFPKALLVMLGSFLVMIPIYFYGKTINGPILCAGLLERGLPGNICTGLLSWPNDYGVHNVMAYAKEKGYFFQYGATLFLGLVPFLLFFKHSATSVVSIKKIFIVFLILILFSLPLFFLSIDWGRWINIHFMLLLLTSSLFLKNTSWVSSLGCLKGEILIPSIWKTTTALSRLSSNMVFFLLCLSYISLWSMRISGHHSIFSLKFYYLIKIFIVKIYNFVV
jgi:hypothetical protein